MIVKSNEFVGQNVSELTDISVLQEKINTKVYCLNDYIIGDELIGEYVFTTNKYTEGRWSWQVTPNSVEVCLFHGREIFPIGIMNPNLEHAVAQPYKVELKEFSLIYGYNGIHVLYKIYTDKTERITSLSSILEKHGVSRHQAEEFFKTTDERELLLKCGNSKTMIKLLKNIAK